jgi:lipoprotein-releasing system permease protein
MRIVKYRIAAIFEVGVYDYDKAFIIMPMEDAQTLLLLGDAVGMIRIDTVNPDKVSEIMAPLEDKVGESGQITDWRQMNRELFEALSVDRIVSFTMLSIILLVASFNIVSSLIMLVRAKTRDIAVLRTMGATRGGLMRIFVTVGTTIGALGVAAGGVLGFFFITFRAQVVWFIGLVTGQKVWDPRCASSPSSRQDRSVPDDRHLRDGLALRVPRHAVSGVEGGEHRSGPGASL